jgi:alanine dehydrogenase
MTRYLAPSLWAELKEFVRILRFDEGAIDKSLQVLRAAVVEADLVISSAVRRPSLPKSACEYLIDRATVAQMRRNRVLCDATGCDRDFVETAVSSAGLNDFYIEEGVIHHNCDHIPSLTPNLSSRRLAEAIYPYVEELAHGFELAVRSSDALRNSVMCHKGHLTHAYSAKKKGLPYAELNTLLA